MVVVHWNQPDECVATVDQLLGSTVPVRVTVVDNASKHAARAELGAGLAERIDEDLVEILDSPSNSGFGPGANVGLQRFLDRNDARKPDEGDWVFVVPHDVQVAPDTIERILDAASQVPTSGLCCGDVGDSMVPVIDPYFGGMVVPGGGSPGGGSPGGGRPGWEPVDYPHGTLMGLRRQCIEEVGLFDERFFSYCEEADLALRARRAGWQVGLVRGAAVTNRGLGSSVWTVDYLQTRNTLLLVQEQSGSYHALVRICFTLVQVVRGTLSPHTRPPVFDAHARLVGIRDFLTRRFGPPPPR